MTKLSESSIFCSNCGKELFAEETCPACGTANPQKVVNSIPSSPSPSPSANNSGSSGNGKHNRNKRFVWIGIGVGAVIALVIASIGINYYALSNLQFRGNTTEDFDFASLSMDMKLDVCNPTAVPANFDKFTVLINYKDKEFATVAIKGKTIPPHQTTTVDGRLSVNAQMMAGLFMQGFANAFSDDAEQQPSFDENDMDVIMTIDSKALGFIPITSSKSFAMSEFQEVMQEQNSDGFSCT